MPVKYFLLALLLCICISTQAQTTLPEFAPHGATWIYETVDYSSNPLYGDHYLATLTVLDSDDVIAGKTCRVFLYQNGYRFFAYRDSLKIYLNGSATSQVWELLYDFGWPVGTVINTPGAYNGSQSTVLRSFDTVINNDTLPALYLSSWPSLVIMNIGTPRNFFIPETNFIPEAGPPSIRCYSDTVLGTIEAPGVVVCDTNFHTGIAQVNNKQEVQLYPNPANDEVHVTGITSNDILSAEIIAADGRIVKNTVTPNASIALDGIANGLYIVVLHMKDGTMTNRKLAVQR